MASTEFNDISSAFDNYWREETTEICKLNTVRTFDEGDDIGKMSDKIIDCKNYIFSNAQLFNETQNTVKFTSFQWCKPREESTSEEPNESQNHHRRHHHRHHHHRPVNPKQDDDTGNYNPDDSEILEAQYAVFGLRFGSENPSYKMTIICHLDTVPADDTSTEWNPFQPVVEFRSYEHGNQGNQNFLVGRGCVDDKGPAISAFIAARCAARAFDDKSMNNVQIELIFDSSEETDMSTPIYLDGSQTDVPDFGIVYDASWIVRAEKGGERPVFTVDLDPNQDSSSGIQADSLITSDINSTNTIPDYCDAVFKGPNTDEVAIFAESIESLYTNAVFDDPNYVKAKMDSPTISEDRLSFSIRTHIAGTQHGSAPEQNRVDGANPLVSMANFINWLFTNGKIIRNHVSTMCSFVAYTWGTHVFGEAHDTLYKYDDVFIEGNGTTYAVTKSEEVSNDIGTKSIQISLDIRYAIPHHSNGWDGVTEGFLEGDNSIFEEVFSQIVSDFNNDHRDWEQVKKVTSTIFAPDIRLPDNPYLSSVASSYKKIMNSDPVAFAAGGGTDAKGHTFLCGAGPLYNLRLGAPINYHGINEGAPMEDIKKSTEILYQCILDQIESPIVSTSQKENNKKNIRLIQRLRKRTGQKIRCSH